jgi:hypothetical protein
VLIEEPFRFVGSYLQIPIFRNLAVKALTLRIRQKSAVRKLGQSTNSF